MRPDAPSRNALFCLIFRLLLVLTLPDAAPLAAQIDPESGTTRLKLQTLPGLGSLETIDGLVVDKQGNAYYALSTGQASLPTVNATQPTMGEAPLVRSMDGGATWQRVPPPPDSPILIAPDPTTLGTLYVVGQKGLYRTTDNGTQWRRLPIERDSYSAADVSIDPSAPQRIAVTINNDLYLSDDRGDTWTRRVCPSTCYWVQFDPAGSGILYLIGTRVLYTRNVDSGFTEVPPPMETFNKSVVLDPRSPGGIYWWPNLPGVPTGVPLYRSENFGQSWTALAGVLDGIHRFAVDPENSNRLIAAGSIAYFTSEDGGRSWATLSGVSPSIGAPLAFLSRTCPNGGSVFGIAGGPFDRGLVRIQGSTLTPVLGQATSVRAGPSCALYSARAGTTDVYLAKVSPEGRVLWATYLGGQGAERDVQLQLGPNGDLYAFGSTTAADFPGPNGTALRVGAATGDSLFVTRFTPEGRMVASTTLAPIRGLGGWFRVLPDGGVLMAGDTGEQAIPITPGGSTEGQYYVARLDADGKAQVLTRWGRNGETSYSLQRGLAVDSQQRPVALTVDSKGAQLVRFTPDLKPESSRPITEFTATYASLLLQDGAGNIYVAGSQTGTIHGSPPPFPAVGGGYRSDLRSETCDSTSRFFPFVAPADLYVAKFEPAQLQLVATALIASKCEMQLLGATAGEDGSISLSSYARLGMPLKSSWTSSGIYGVTVLSPDLSALRFSSFVPAYRVTGAANNDHVYVARTWNSEGNVFRLGNSPGGVPVIDRVIDAYSGDPIGASKNQLISIRGNGFGEGWHDRGLNAAGPLDTELAGVRVFVNGAAAPIHHVSEGRVLAVVPTESAEALYRVQVEYRGVRSAVVEVERGRSEFPPSLLTASFPETEPYTGAVDGIVRNADGSLNGPDNPALAGSVIRLFTNAVGDIAPPVIPGAIATSDTSRSPRRFSVRWDGASVPSLDLGTATLPGFITSFLQTWVTVPEQLRSETTKSHSLALGWAQPGARTTYGNRIRVYVR